VIRVMGCGVWDAGAHLLPRRGQRRNAVGVVVTDLESVGFRV
jgi:hypothetical protein